MVHIPSSDVYQEMLKTPHLVRLTSADGKAPDELTLVVKCSTFLLRYFLLGSEMKLKVFRTGAGVLCYGVQIQDDESPATMWSAALTLEEVTLFHRLTTEKLLVIHLFNEACANVASVSCEARVGKKVASTLELSGPLVGSVDDLSPEVDELIDRFAEDADLEIQLISTHEWKAINTVYVTNSLDISRLNLKIDNEGGQQEQLVRWLTDSLSPSGAILSPQLHEPSGRKELTDILLSYDGGVVIIESKALNLSARPSLPTRDDLSGDIAKIIKKDGVRVLRTACRKIREGKPIFEKLTRAEIRIERTPPVHAICLVSDLTLVRDRPEFGRTLLKTFAQRTGCFFHLLDTVQLFRVVQAAQILAKASSGLTPMKAFDGYLIERFNFAITIDDADFDMVLSMGSSPQGIRFIY